MNKEMYKYFKLRRIITILLNSKIKELSVNEIAVDCGYKRDVVKQLCDLLVWLGVLNRFFRANRIMYYKIDEYFKKKINNGEKDGLLEL